MDKLKYIALARPVLMLASAVAGVVWGPEAKDTAQTVGGTILSVFGL